MKKNLIFICILTMLLAGMTACGKEETESTLTETETILSSAQETTKEMV